MTGYWKLSSRWQFAVGYCISEMRNIRRNRLVPTYTEKFVFPPMRRSDKSAKIFAMSLLDNKNT